MSTSHEPHVIADAQALSDLVVAWWGDKVHGIAYRCRTTPETSTNVALLSHAPVRGRSQALHRARGLLDTLIVRHGFMNRPGSTGGSVFPRRLEHACTSEV